MSELFVEPFDFAKTGHRSLDLLAKLLAGHDFNVPATELAGQANVLTSFANRQRQLVLRNEHNRAANHLTKQNLIDFGRLQGVGDEQFGVVTVADNIDPFVVQLLDNVFDSTSSDADTCPDTVNSRVAAAHGHLATVARLARNRVDLNDSVGNFWNLLLKQLLHQLGPSSTENDFDPAALGAYFSHHGPNSLIRMMRFAWNLFASRQNCFDIVDLHRRRSAIRSLHDAVDEQPQLFVEIVHQRIAFGFSNLLNDDLLSRLGTDAADNVVD